MRGATQAFLYNYERPTVFQSTRPVRGATNYLRYTDYEGVFQSTRPVRGATPASKSYVPFQVISIHAPRAGRDVPVGYL